MKRRAQARRRRRARHGGGGNRQPICDRRTLDHRLQRHPAPAADDLAAHPRNRRRASSPRVPTRSSSSTARISPTAWRAACAPARRRSRSSIMCRRRSGLGGPGRARAMRGYVDCVLAILPFEPAPHQRLGGPPCVYVGHPLIERLAELRPNAEEARRRRADPPLVLVLPGSRSSEIRRLLAIFGDAIARVAARIGPMELVLPDHAASCGARARRPSPAGPLPPRIVVEPAEKWAASAPRARRLRRPAPLRSSLRLPACRPLPPIGSRLSRR